jgi:histidinol-phosphate phosphatase family protein
MTNNPAIFLDRDGTIIEDRGHITSPRQIVFYEYTFEALKKLQQKYKLFIVTNQSGIAKGIVNPDQVRAVNTHIAETLNAQGITITDVYVCPHQRDDNCKCIKPKPYFTQKAAADHDIDLKRSFSIGDHPCDVQLAHNAGGKGIYLLTGHGKKHLPELTGSETIAKNLAEAAKFINNLTKK